MNKLKLIGPTIIAMTALMLSAQSHAEGRVFGNVGIEDAPWSILIGYNDYGRDYYQPGHVEHHHYYYKPRHHYRHGRGHAYGHRYRKHHRRYHHRGHYDRYSHYNRRH